MASEDTTKGEREDPSDTENYETSPQPVTEQEAPRKKRSREEPDNGEARIEPFLDMRDPTFRRILQAATQKYNQMLCPIMASVCVRDLCMFWNEHSESCLIVDGLKNYLFHVLCPKCQSTNVLSSRGHGSGKERIFRCLTCGNEWGQVH
jgi:hypothetical protein